MNDIDHDMYLPVHSSDRCSSGWKIKREHVARGGFGSIAQACCDSDCTYVAKIQTLKSHFPHFLNTLPITLKEWENEVSMQKKASEIGVAMPIVDSYHNDNMYAVIIMYRLEETLLDRINYLLRDPIKNKEDIFIYYSKFIELHMKLIDNNISHFDAHLANAMFDNDNDLFLIDFGKAKKIHDKVYHKKMLVFYIIFQINELIRKYNLLHEKTENELYINISNIFTEFRDIIEKKYGEYII